VSDRITLDRFAVNCPAGTCLFREGDEGSQMYVVQSGEVEISRQMGDSEQVLAVVTAGEFFGEMAIVNNRPRSATAIVRQDASLLVIGAHTFESMLRSKPEIAARMIKLLAGRLERANQQIELLLLRDTNHRVVRCLRQMAEEESTSRSLGAGAVLIPATVADLARRVALDEAEVADAVTRLGEAGLVEIAGADEAPAGGFLIPEVGRLIEFLSFLELRSQLPRT
jgi:CRP-like cAMP-binding protein